MDASAHDLLLVGGGAVGVRATIAAVELNAKHSIVIVSTVYPMGSHTVSAQGSAAAVVNETSTDVSYDTVSVVTGVVIRKRSRPFIKEAPL